MSEMLVDLDPENLEDAIDPRQRLVLDIDGFEGPIDLLLHLARDQKVDLAAISVLELSEQYLTFIRTAQDLRIELAADYLVMAAWLTYLKSKLLIPVAETSDENSGVDMALDLTFQLQRLDAMRTAAKNLLSLPQLGQERFSRGATTETLVEKTTEITSTLFDLLRAYARQRGRIEAQQLDIGKPELFSFEAATQRLKLFIGKVPDWRNLLAFLPDDLRPGIHQKSAIATTFVTGLQMVRQGSLEMKQDKPFAPILMRSLDGSKKEQSPERPEEQAS